MELVSLQIGIPKTPGDAEATDPMDKEWESGIFKDPVHGSVVASHTGLAGDGQADLVNHGGPDKAINVYPQEHFVHWKKELGLDCQPGAFGENFTTEGLTEEEVFIGDIFKISGITVQISQPRQPCWKLARKWRVKSLAALVQKTGYTGWYFRVLESGEVGAPEKFELLDRPHPEWSVAQANHVMYELRKDGERSFQLGSCRALSESWRNTLLSRVSNR